MVTSSLTRPDPRARIRLLFRQQLQVFLNNAEPVADDPTMVYQDRVWELEMGYTACPHYLQPDFLTTYARKHMADIIARRDDILARFRAFHQDVPFVTYLRDHYPHLYCWFKWEVLTLALAEKHDAATRDDGTPITAPAKKKPTPIEVRAFKVRRQQVQTDDMIALARARLEATLKARQFLDEYELDEDERQQYERELTADIQAGQEEPTTTHKQPTTGYKQL